MNSDYYPFGMEMPGRHTNEQNYRFGYNGMELDNEVKGNGNSYTTEFRQYDPRLGRWLSLDPLMSKFPWMSPYAAFNNNPIFYTDPLGLAPGGPPEIINIIKTGKKESAVFKRLLKENGITEENYQDIISYGTGTYTINDNGNIVLDKNSSTDVKRMIIELTHELTNRKNLERIQELDRKVERGLITPAEYAKELEIVELDGQINQAKVAAAIGYKYGNKNADKLIEAYRKDPSINLRKYVSTGDVFYEKYKAQGERARNNYLNNKANIQKIQDTEIKFDSNVAKPSKDKQYLIVKDLKTGKEHQVTRDSKTGKYYKYDPNNDGKDEKKQEKN